MTRTYTTIREAAELWVSQMNAIPLGMIEQLIENCSCGWREVTTPAVGDRVFVYRLPDDAETLVKTGEITAVNKDGTYTIELSDETVIESYDDEFEVERDSSLPMWGWMWQFGDSADDWWLEEDDGIKALSECGFRVYEHDEFGFFFGIDGAGYDFYEAHWCPLYKARGLKWHDVEE